MPLGWACVTRHALGCVLARVLLQRNGRLAGVGLGRSVGVRADYASLPCSAPAAVARTGSTRASSSTHAGSRGPVLPRLRRVASQGQALQHC
eukprot:364329-Chlamydomonas_euryale.AAC.9